MKTIGSKILNTKNVILALLVAFMSLFFAFSGFGQEITQKLSNTESLFAQMKVHEPDTSYTHKWNENKDSWELFSRKINLYDEKHLLLATLNERWDPVYNQWKKFDRSIKSYNEKGKVLESLHQKWSPKQSEWVNLQLKTFTYDRNGNKSEILYHEWQQAAGQWFSTVRYLIDYNTEGQQNEVLIKVYSPATESWLNDIRYTFIYHDKFGLPDEALVESWDSFTESWDNRGKYYMHYDLRGNKVKETRATWNQSMSDWVNGLRFLRDYDSKNLVSEIEQRWDFRTGEWNNAIRNLFSYDEEGDLRQMTEERWNRDSSGWTTKNIYLYSDMKTVDNQPPEEAGEKK